MTGSEAQESSNPFKDFEKSITFLESIVNFLKEIFDYEAFKEDFAAMYGKDNIQVFDYALKIAIERFNGEIDSYKKHFKNLNDKNSKTTIQKLYNELEKVGLTNEELDFKIKAFDTLKNTFIKRKVGKYLLNLLKVMNGILGSFSIVNPVIHAVKELKDLSEPAIDSYKIYYNEKQSPKGNNDSQSDESSDDLFGGKVF